MLLLGTAMAISAIPTGLPAFVSGLLSMGAKELADVEGGREEPDRRRDARRDERDQHRQDRHPDDEPDDGLGHLRRRRMVQRRGRGLPKDGRHHVGRRAPRCRTSPGWRSVSCSTATPPSATTAIVVGDPTEAALVVLAAKLGVDAEETRRAYPRLAEVPFDSDYKFMATFHRVTLDGTRARHPARQGRPRRRAGPLHPLRRPGGGGAGADRARPAPDIDAANERHGREGPAGARLRRPLRRRRRVATRCPPTRCRSSSDLAFVGHGRDHRPAAGRGRRPPCRRRSGPASTCG